MKKNNKLKISLIMNIIIFILVLLATLIMFTGFKFMHGHEVVLESSKFGMFKYYTVQSNLFIGISALIFAIKEIQLLKGKTKKIEKRFYVLKLVATSTVSLTFVIVFTYLAAIVKGGLLALLMNSGLFYHFIIPVLSIICFIFFENNNEIKFKEVIYGIIPTTLYAIYYLLNVLIHMENGKVSMNYDWYCFVYYGVWTAVIVIPIMLLLIYLINLILWYLNKKMMRS